MVISDWSDIDAAKAVVAVKLPTKPELLQPREDGPSGVAKLESISMEELLQLSN